MALQPMVFERAPGESDDDFAARIHKMLMAANSTAAEGADSQLEPYDPQEW
jgi:hypothetical protein